MIAGAVALACVSTTALAQTDFGKRYFEVGPSAIEPGVNLDTGFGVVLKYNAPVASWADLHARGTYITFSDYGANISEWSARAGGTIFVAAAPIRPFVSAEIRMVRAAID